MNKKKALLFSLIVTITFVFIIINNKISFKQDEPLEPENEVANNSVNEISSEHPNNIEVDNKNNNENTFFDYF